MLLLTLAGASLNVQRTNLQTQSQSENSRQATELGQSALNYALMRLQEDQVWNIPAPPTMGMGYVDGALTADWLASVNVQGDLKMDGAVVGSGSLTTKNLEARGKSQLATTPDLQVTLYAEQKVRLTSAAPPYQAVTSVDWDASSTILETSGRPKRHGLCCPTLSRWDLPTSYSAQSGLPDWDRYLGYYATLQQPTGRLLRCLYNPGAAKAHNPWAAFNAPAHLREDPSSTPTRKAIRPWADDVQELTFGTDGKVLLVKLILEKQGKTTEMRLEVRPQNEEP